MISDDQGNRQNMVITRRKVVKTGVKLAYAAPVVVATFKLTEGGALAASCPRQYVFDATGPFGAGCYRCTGEIDVDCSSLRDASECPNPRTDREGYRACRRAQVEAYRECRSELAACRRARYYNPETNRCETRAGVSGGEGCAPAFAPVTTP